MSAVQCIINFVYMIVVCYVVEAHNKNNNNKVPRGMGRGSVENCYSVVSYVLQSDGRWQVAVTACFAQIVEYRVLQRLCHLW